MAKKEHRRGKGEGTIYQRADGTWTSQVPVGHNPQTGKLKRRTFYGKTRNEVVQKMTKALHELQTGDYIEPSEVTVEKWFTDWMTGRKPFLEETTYLNRMSYLRNYIIPKLGKIKLKDLRTRDIQNFINDLVTSGRMDGRGEMSKESVRKIYQLVHAGLEKAVMERVIPHSITGQKLIELPQMRKKEMQTLNQQELDIFLEEAESDPYFMAFLLESVTGLRRGELLGIRWSDLDTENCLLNIRQQLTHKGQLKGLKTDSSMRSISLHPRIIETLKVYKAKQSEIRLRLGEAYSNEDLMFCKVNGERLPQRTFYDHFKKVLGNSKINKKIRFHDLRHTFVTLGLEDGINYKALQKMTGHSSIKTFFDVYGHVTEKMQNEAAETIGNRVLKHTCSKHAVI